MTMTLIGDRCQCAACLAYFNSTAAFDKHRAGEHGASRRCLSAVEMRSKGMSQSADGWWLTRLPDPASAARLKALTEARSAARKAARS